MHKVFNFTNRKVGGIRFFSLGRFNIQFSLTSKSAYAAKQHAKASKALEASCTAFLNGWTVEGYARHLEVMVTRALDDAMWAAPQEIELEAHGMGY